eukprot:7384427-Prymnesium_polylepis.1
MASIAKAVTRVASYSSESHKSESPEDPRRRARKHQKGETERRRQHPLQPGGERGADAPRKRLIAPLAATQHDFRAKKAHDTSKYDDQWPGRAHPYACAVIAQACGGHHKDALKLKRQLEELDPLGEVLQPERWPHVIDARHCSEALIEAHQCLELAVCEFLILLAAECPPKPRSSSSSSTTAKVLVLAATSSQLSHRALNWSKYLEYAGPSHSSQRGPWGSSCRLTCNGASRSSPSSGASSRRSG